MSAFRSIDRFRTATAVACAAAWLAISVGGAAAATWTLQTTPNRAGADHSALYDLACEPASTNACIAVGKTRTGAVGAPYAQRWDGSTWVEQLPAAPPGATDVELRAVHCAAARSCVAVGAYTTGSGFVSLVQTWNGTAWSTQAVPPVTGATETRLEGVACATTTTCLAVGFAVVGGDSEPISARLSSGTWTLQTVPPQAGASESSLLGVDCPTTTSCIAVGWYVDGAAKRTAMSATWNGTVWALQTVPEPAGALHSILHDVSCSDTANCTAAGAHHDGSRVQRALAERWNGRAWTAQTPPTPAGSTNTVLQNVSCEQRHSCVAVGDYLSGSWTPMAQYWNSATGWTLDSAVSRAGATFGLLEGVACRLTCLAVGWTRDAGSRETTLAERRDVPAWSQQVVPNPASINRLEGISCQSGPVCVAVGHEANPGPADEARTYVYSGGAWATSGQPIPAGASTSRLQEVSCVSASSCVAVGEYQTSGGVEKPYAASYASGTWTVLTVPLPAGMISGRLYDVSCTAANACRAVGAFINASNGDSTLIVAWNGRAWTIEPSPNIGAATTINRLLSVSCFSTGCMAVGYGNAGATLVERWDGTRWVVGTNPLPPPGAIVTDLRTVHCVGASDCTAAGSGAGYGYASRWNGATWTTLANSPDLAFSTFEYFEDISCTSTVACTGVGAYLLGPGSGFLAANWDGTGWTLHSVPAPTGTWRSLEGVSCLTSTSCFAVGSEGSGAPTQNVAQRFP